MASIEKRGRFYTVRWKEHGVSRQRGRIPTHEAAKVIQREVEIAVARGERWSGDAGTAPTLEAAVGAYLVDCARLYAPSTIARNGGAIARWQDAHPGATLASLTTEAIEAWHGHHVQRGASPIHAEREARALDGLLTWCAGQDDYAEHVRRRRPLRMPGAQPRLLATAPSWDQMDAAIGAARGWYRDLFVVLRCTGLRGQQAMYLRWEHVDLTAATLTIPPDHHGSKTRQERRGRIVPLAPVLVRELAGWGRREGWLIDKTQRPDKAPAGSDDRRWPMDHEAARGIWTRAGVPQVDRQQPVHGFRRGFISGLAEAGVPEEHRKPLVGHSGGVHGDVYTVWRVLEPHLRAAVAKVPPIATGRVLALAVNP